MPWNSSDGRKAAAPSAVRATYRRVLDGDSDKDLCGFLNRGLGNNLGHVEGDGPADTRRRSKNFPARMKIFLVNSFSICLLKCARILRKLTGDVCK